MPPQIRDFLYYKPVLHIIELFRLGMYDQYPTIIFSQLYLSLFCLISVSLGATLIWHKRADFIEWSCVFSDFPHILGSPKHWFIDPRQVSSRHSCSSCWSQPKSEYTSHNKPGTSHNGRYVKQLMVEFDTPYLGSIGGDLGIRSDQPQPFDLGSCDQDTVEQIVL